MVTGASQYLQGWSKVVKTVAREMKKPIKRGLDSELAGIFTTRLVNSEYAVLVKPRGTDQQESCVFSSGLCMKKRMHLCHNEQYSAEYTNILPKPLHTAHCSPERPMKRGEERQDSKLYLPTRGRHPMHLQCLFSCCRSNISSCGGWAPHWIGIHRLVWLLKVESCVCN